MKTPLRALFVEDSEYDTLLVMRHLEKAGYSMTHARVETEEEMREAIARETWDLVICDYQLPRFDAPAALRLVAAAGLDLPFIVVSGAISAKLAVEMMRQGAQDYLFKEDLSRLAPVVERELREAEIRKARRRAEEAQRQTEDRYRELFQFTSDLILCFEVDSGGASRLSQWNATAARLLGLDGQGEGGCEAASAAFFRRLREALAKARPAGPAGDLDLVLEAREPSGAHQFHATLHCVHGDDSRVRRVFVVARDVTERRRAERELRKARDELEHRVAERTAELTRVNERLRELDRLKSEFLATMSHELRTPLNSIIGFTGLVKDEIAGPLNAEQKKQLGMAYSSSKHLLGLINDLLDVSRIEAGRVKLDREAFDFAGVVAEAVAQVKPLALAKRLALRPVLPAGALPMLGDRRRCLQILLNLAHNAVKFTEAGSVEIAVRAEAAILQIDVTDTGMGMSPEQLGHAFEAFRQFDNSARRNREGTGLGLYLCRKLLNLMGGDISVRSEAGRGTQFTVHLPRQLAASATPPPPASSQP